MMNNSSGEIWIVSYHFHPVWSGPAERFVRYGKYFREKGEKPVYFTVARNGETEGQYRGLPLRFAGTEEDSIRSFIHLIGDLAIKEKPRTVLVLLADWKNTDDIRRMRRAGIPVIYVNTMVQQRSGSANPVKRLFSDYLNRRYLSSYSKIVCSTGALSSAMINFGIREDKVTIISNGVDLQRFHPVEAEERQRLRQELSLPSGFIVLFVGLKLERKGILELLEGWLHYKTRGGSGTLLLVGDEQRDNPAFEAFYEKWDGALERIKESDQVIMHGPAMAIEKYFQCCDLFAFLSKKEGMPNVLTEAMACHLPILLAPFEGFSGDWGNPEEHYFMLEDRSPETISEKLSDIVNNAGRREKIAEQALNLVRENHEILKSIQRYTEILS